MVDRTAHNLDLLDRETERLLARAETLTEKRRADPTLCQDWDVAQLLTHIARNADALVNLVRWAQDGRKREAYASEQARDQEIEDGAARPLAEIVEDLRTSARTFRDEAQSLLGPAGQAEVRTRTGTPVTGAQVISMRILEVVFHHVDLGHGYTFDDADPGLVLRTLRRGVRQWAANDGPVPDLTLLPDGEEPLVLGSGGPKVTGTPGQILLWLARGRAEGLRADVDLPTPPPWA